MASRTPPVVDPGIGDKLEILHLLDELGVYSTDVGLPGAGPRAFDDVLTLVREIANQKLNIIPTCAGRTLVGDIEPMVEVSQKAGHSRRGHDLHRQLTDPPVRRELDARTHHRAFGQSNRFRGERGPSGHLRHRGHDTQSSAFADRPLFVRPLTTAPRASVCATPSGTSRPTGSTTSSGSRVTSSKAPVPT